MPDIKFEFFQRAAADIGSHGDNDTLPFDIDNRFIADKKNELAKLAFDFFSTLQSDSVENSKNKIKSLNIFSERLLVPTGPTGFRITTKIHPFWNIYFNGLGIAIANAFENDRSDRVHSYRFLENGEHELFDRESSWRKFREMTILDCNQFTDTSVIIQTDISSFYERISHHYIENFLEDLFPDNFRVARQVNALLDKFSGGRSFGLPVGGQCSRILAELFLKYADRALSEAGVVWRRYVDDYVLIASSQAEAYSALSTLSHILADYGASLNKTKTIMLSKKHYVDYVKAQLGNEDDEGALLREIDLHFDPYSDNPEDDYEALSEVVGAMEIQKLLGRELEKSLPDTFLVSQIARTLRLQKPDVAIQLCETILDGRNLHSFRASWSTIMRGIAAVRAQNEFTEIFKLLDVMIDTIPESSPHLIHAEASLLHYLRTLRFEHTENRARFVRSLYESTKSRTVKRACLDCWRIWRDRQTFTFVRNKWATLSSDEQRVLWLSSYEFGDEGEGFRRQTKSSLDETWRLGIENQKTTSFSKIYGDWCAEA